MHSCVFLLLAMAGIVNSKVIALHDHFHEHEHALPELHEHEHANAEESNQPGKDEIRKAVCNLKSPNENFNISGKVLMRQLDPMGPVTIIGNITATTQEDINGLHGFHIHQFSVIHGICTEAGGHYNPHGKEHGGPKDEERHVGDLGNISFEEINSYGSSKTRTFTSNFQMNDSLVTLYGDYSVGGRAIVIHRGEDDLGTGPHDDSKKTGHAGARIACCNINMVILKKNEENIQSCQIFPDSKKK